MDKTSRRQAAADWKARKRDVGVFALRGPDAVWVGATNELGAAERRLLFSLRTGGGRPAALQAAWNAQGADAFAFEVLERLDEEKLGPALPRVLEARRDHWRETLGGLPL